MSDTEIDILNISQFDKKENKKENTYKNNTYNTNNTNNTNHKNTNSEEEVDDMLKYFAYLYKENPDKSINFLKSYCNSLIFRYHGNYEGY
jgi:cephalosporin hydroxylase